jgi:hypothetical protein
VAVLVAHEHWAGVQLPPPRAFASDVRRSSCEYAHPAVLAKGTLICHC